MPSHVRDITNELLAALRTDWGVYDLSTVTGTPRVRLGIAVEPPVDTPFVWLAVPESIETSHEGAPLRSYAQIGTFEYHAFCPSDSLENDERILDGYDFHEEMERVITLAWRNPANVELFKLTHLLCTITESVGQAADIPDTLVSVKGQISYRRIAVGGI